MAPRSLLSVLMIVGPSLLAPGCVDQPGSNIHPDCAPGAVVARIGDEGQLVCEAIGGVGLDAEGTPAWTHEGCTPGAVVSGVGADGPRGDERTVTRLDHVDRA